MNRTRVFVVIALSMALIQTSAAAQIQTVQADVDLVSVYFTVRDAKQNLVTNLDRTRFKVLEDGREHALHKKSGKRAKLPSSVEEGWREAPGWCCSTN